MSHNNDNDNNNNYNTDTEEKNSDIETLIKDIKFSTKSPVIAFLPRRNGLGYVSEFKKVDKTQFKKSISVKNKKSQKKQKVSIEAESSDTYLIRGSKK